MPWNILESPGSRNCALDTEEAGNGASLPLPRVRASPRPFAGIEHGGGGSGDAVHARVVLLSLFS